MQLEVEENSLDPASEEYSVCASTEYSVLGVNLDEHKVLCTEAFVLWKIKFNIGDLHIDFP